MENLINSMNVEISHKGIKLSNEQVELVANARVAMQNGEVKLTFRKANGDIRVVERATTRGEVVSKTGVGNSGRALCVTPFYDVDNQNWRSFSWANLISFEVL